MLDKPEIVETAQILLKAIGHDSVLGYFNERLKAGKELPSRPWIIRAYAKLADADAIPLLIQVVKDQAETPDSRVAAIKALSSLVTQQPSAIKRHDIVTLIMPLLDDINQEVCSAAALTLVELQAIEAVPRLRQLRKTGRMNIIAEEEVRKFLSTVEAPTVEGIIPVVDHFVGRHSELQALTEVFEKSKIVALVGLGGIGKTALAAQFAYQSSHEIKLWLSCRRQTDLADLAIEALRQVDAWHNVIGGISIWTDLPTPFDWRAVESRLTQMLVDRTVLLVIDDYETIHREDELAEFVRTLMAQLPKLNCLLVGRRSTNILDAIIIPLGNLSDKDANELIQTELVARGLGVDAQMSRRLRDLAQGHPLLIKLGAEVPTSAPLETFSPNQRQDFLGYVLERSLRGLNISQRRTIEVLAQFDEPINIQNTVIRELFELEQIGSLSEILQGLEHSGLISNTGKVLVIVHTLVRDYVRQQTDIRTAFRVNQTIANYYREQGDILRAATHLARADMPVEAVNLIADYLFNIINQGHAARANTLLVEDLAQAEQQPTANLRRLTSIGDLSSLLGEPHRAIMFYEQALAIARKIGNRLDEGRILNNLAIVYQGMGDYTAARAMHEQVLSEIEASGDKRNIATALHQLGKLDQAQGNYSRAQACYEQSLEISEELGDQAGVASNSHQLGSLYYSQGTYDRAREHYEQSLAIFQKLGYRVEAARVLGDLGMLARSMGRYDEARHLYQQSLTIEEELGNRAGIANSLGQLGILHYLQGEYKAAGHRYEQALEINQKLGNQAGIATVLYQLGILHQAQGEYEAARHRYEQALEINQKLGNQAGIANSLGQLGLLHQAQGEYEAAGHRYEQALEINQKLGNQAGIATALHQLGTLHQAQGEYEAAGHRYEQALEINQKLGNQAGIATALHQLGDLHYLQDKYEDARHHYEQALEINQKLGNQAGIATALHQLGLLHQAQGEYEAARRRYEQALKINQKLGDRAGIANSLGQLGLLFEQEGEFEQAVQLSVQALLIFEQLGSPNRELAHNVLGRLQKKMGVAAFEAALRAVLPPEAQAHITSAVEASTSGTGMTRNQAIEIVVNNTIAVLTQAPDKQEAWRQGLGALAAQAKSANDDSLAAFLDLLRQLVEGAAPENLTASVPAEFQPAWAAVVARIGAGSGGP